MQIVVMWHSLWLIQNNLATQMFLHFFSNVIYGEILSVMIPGVIQYLVVCELQDVN